MRLILASVAIIAITTGSALAQDQPKPDAAPAAAAAPAAVDLAKGENAFKKCMACHAVGPGAKAKVGPPLNGIVGAKWAHFEGYAYSQDIKDGAAAGKVWDDASLNAYLTNPKALAPKGKMAFAGIKSEAERADLIGYLAQFDLEGNKK
ncbi:c-type cytochrome [Xanthobacter tagetidis]|uniref:Cytochrome c family protein n=1 Tax=Xanthobacter tagetidis TaxID=60216 RepID=A0A3L7A0L5_9HYPH|nr:c-type cytochrome [Xanthobacter tagetidis]MBB6309504.1 cytochrome c [Xanthobacter tagetidis]RLP73614.1 cytochrome c family protein [Xanthobacter tagetidis]